MNKIVIIVIVILILIVGGYFLLKGGYRAPAPVVPAPEAIQPKEEIPSPTSSEAREFTVSGAEFSFSPASITVKAGDRVKIIFRNDGGALHNLIIEGLGVSTKTISGGQTDIVEFTAPASGTYTIFCSVPGHRVAGMEGSLIIE